MTGTLVASGVSHGSAPVAVRERLGLPAGRAEALLRELVADPAVEEAVALSTCNRTELYLVARDHDRAASLAEESLVRVARMPLGPALRVRSGLEAAHHLFRVAAGLESMVVGEAEIQGQVRRAYELALAAGTSGRISNRLFQDALRAGKRVRSETGIARAPASVASVAVDLARRRLGGLAGRHVLVIGAGKHAELTARRLAEGGADTVFIANRHHERAASLARRHDGSAVRFEGLAADLVLTCTACPQRILTRADLAGCAPLMIIDTAIPRDVEPAARSLAGIELYDLDDLEREVARGRSARAQQARCAEPIVEDELARFARWLASLEVVPTISALRERGRVAVERALRENEPSGRALSDGDRERLALVACAVASHLLHEPTLRLRRAGERGSPSPYLETVRELFGLSSI